MKELLKSKNRHILSDQKVTRISIDACSTTLSLVRSPLGISSSPKLDFVFLGIISE